MSVHVIPLNDWREHEENEACWCQPRFDEGVFVHNAADHREIIEVLTHEAASDDQHWQVVKAAP